MLHIQQFEYNVLGLHMFMTCNILNPVKNTELELDLHT